MMFFMTGKAKDFQIVYDIILSILIFVMNFKFTFFLSTAIAFFRKMFESKLPVTSDPSGKSRVFFTRWFVPNKFVEASLYTCISWNNERD